MDFRVIDVVKNPEITKKMSTPMKPEGKNEIPA
jgi:hypothetical protein